MIIESHTRRIEIHITYPTTVTILLAVGLLGMAIIQAAEILA